jgi:hypothetical protein
MLTSNAAERLTDRRVLGVEWMACHAASAGNGGDATAQSRHRVAFAGGGQVGADSLGRGRHRRQAVLAAPGLEVGKVGGVGPSCRRRVSGVLVSLRLREGQAGRAVGGLTPSRRTIWRLRASENGFAIGRA